MDELMTFAFLGSLGTTEMMMIFVVILPFRPEAAPPDCEDHRQRAQGYSSGRKPDQARGRAGRVGERNLSYGSAFSASSP